jgi:VWFA-related protein
MRAVAIAFATVLIGSGAAQETTPDPNPTFKSSAREVLLEVAIRDPRGRLVNKVDPSQVTVYEDGVPQTIRSFHLVQGREVREQDAKQMAQTALTEPASTNGARAPFNPLRTVNLVCLILNDLGPDTRAFAFDAARKFVNKELRPDTFIGVFSLDASGLRPVFPFSNNREHLLKAVALASVNQLPTLTQSTAAMLNGLSATTIGVTVGDSGNADGSTAKDPLGTRGDIGVAVNAGLREIDALLRLVKQLSSFPFQKTVLLMSTGLTRPPDQIEYWQSLISAANKGGVTFYGLDVYGLGPCQDSSDVDCVASGNTAVSAAFLQKTADLSRQQIQRGWPNQGGGATTGPPAAGQGVGSGISPTAQMMELAHQTDYLRFGVLSANKQEALRELSESTGGFIIANTNNTEKLLARVMEDVDTHYELAYRPASTINDGHFRKIEAAAISRCPKRLRIL